MARFDPGADRGAGLHPGGRLAAPADLDRQSVSLRGETRDAGAALGALEASAAFTGAAFTAPVSKTPDGSDVFELRADRPAGRGAGE